METLKVTDNIENSDISEEITAFITDDSYASEESSKLVADINIVLFSCQRTKVIVCVSKVFKKTDF